MDQRDDTKILWNKKEGQFLDAKTKSLKNF